MELIGIFGGTFDPIHNGHLQMAIEAKGSLGLDEIKFVPCHCPPHRDTPVLTSRQRLALLSLALEGQEGLTVDDRELHREQASYTVDTLLSFRQEYGEAVSLVLLMGADAFAQLTTWHQWQQLRQLAHIAVMARPDSATPIHGILNEWVAHANSAEIITQQPSGGLVMLSQSLLPISATHIRQQLMNNESVTDIPSVVADYITQHSLYQKASIRKQ